MPVAPAGRARVLRSDRGANPIELAILLPVITFALLASIQVSLYYLARSEALGAAQQGVTAQRAYLARTGSGTATANQFVAHGDGWLAGEASTVSCPIPGSGDTTTPCTAASTGVTITVTGFALSLVPGWNLAVTQSAHGTIERITHPVSP
jgi:Flp pilus assembly protein TadG